MALETHRPGGVARPTRLPQSSTSGRSAERADPPFSWKAIVPVSCRMRSTCSSKESSQGPPGTPRPRPRLTQLRMSVDGKPLLALTIFTRASRAPPINNSAARRVKTAQPLNGSVVGEPSLTRGPEEWASLSYGPARLALSGAARPH